MFNTITPEAAGIPSEAIEQYISLLERRGMTTHGLIMMKGDNIFAEYYWAPYTAQSCHRMYSQTKSYVSMAIGLLEADGLLSLDDRIADHFPERIDGPLSPELATLTIRQMLTMTTTGSFDGWFTKGDADRTHLYFAAHPGGRPAGTLWEYDSAGSQVLSSLVEKLTGMRLMDFLRERVFRHMGSFTSAGMLATPNGDTWGDSSLLCTLRDMASFGRLLMKGGCWQQKQLLPAEYIKKATASQVDNNGCGYEPVFSHGYGYQIWRTEQNGFSFFGMGDQITICLPDQDVLFSIVSDNQGFSASTHMVVGGFFDLVLSRMQAAPLPEDNEAALRLQQLGAALSLRALHGPEYSPLREKIDGRMYRCAPNHMGIEQFCFAFTAPDEGELRYTNAQGEKVLPFGINKNVFGHFPQLGYSDGAGGVVTDNGFMYRDAVSLCWADETRLRLRVQIIDRYLGNFDAQFAFRDDLAAARFTKTAENFLNEYEGTLTACTTL